MHYKFQPYSEQAFLYLNKTLEDPLLQILIELIH